MSKNDYIGGDKTGDAASATSKGKTPGLIRHGRGSSSSVQMVEDIGNATEVKAVATFSKRRRIRNHFRKFWIYYGIGVVIILAIVLPVLFLVIIPKIAQRLVNDGDFPIYAVTIRNPKADSVDISLSTSLRIPKLFSVRLDPLTLQLYRPEETEFIPFLEITLPSYELKGNTNITIENQTVTIGNMDQFTKLLRNAVVSETFVMAARGKTRAHFGALHADVTLDKQITLNGLNNLQGFSIDSVTAVLPPEADGTNLRARITIPNRSSVAFDLGNETLNINGPDELILGSATISNVYIQPGNNTFDTSGVLDLAVLINNLQELMAYWAPSLENGNIKLAASGNATVFNGLHVKYYEDIFNEIQIEAEVPVTDSLANILGSLLGSTAGEIRNLTQYLDVNRTESLG